MRMYKPLFLLMALFVGPAFAADGVVASRVIPENLNAKSGDSETVARTTSRGTTSRVVSGAGRESGTTEKQSRTTVSRSTSNVVSNDATRGTVSRAGGATSSTKSRSTSGDINNNPVVRRAGVVLRPSFADYGGRATIAGTDRQTGSNVDNDIQKVVSSRVAKGVQATKESIADAREKIELTAELNKSCQDQYNECMDQFCAVVDANQKRCSCSANLSKYSKVEKAVTEANTQLNEVAQAIRYVGLSADEIRAIMTATEAEEALDKTKDTSTTRNMLKQIESMIKDPTSSISNYYLDNSWNLDLDLNFSSEPIDIFNLELWTTGTDTSSIARMRGTELYNTAKKRCKTILTQCKDAGAIQDQITGNYDLAIDKDCIAYEAGLKKMNETLLSNVKSANLMLQKARLAVLQNKNQYDALGCVSALETCMKDDMVCGDDYFKCVDPTKAYIDENGEVVLGQDITVIQSFMTEYNNAAIDKDFLSDAYSSNTQIGKNTCVGDGKCVVKYLLQKIGTKQKSTDEGLCRPVLDKCQYYTYNTSNKKDQYNPYNDIVVNYIQRAMVNIKAAQQKIISDYASSCIIDVATCYNQQVTQVNAWASAASASNIYGVMRGACRSVALTCGLAIFTGEPTIEVNQDLSVDGKTYHVSGCPLAGSETYGSSKYNDAIINCVSDMFYQSLLCPDNSTYDKDGSSSIDSNGTSAGWVNTKCKCNTGYDVWAGACLIACGSDQYRNPYGTCTCTGNKTMRNGVCVDSSSSSSGGGGNSGGNSGGDNTTTYTISYNCNGGSGSVSSQTCNSGATVTLKSVSGCGTKSNETPTGWNNNATTYTCTGDKTFTAQWPGSTPIIYGADLKCNSSDSAFRFVQYSQSGSARALGGLNSGECSAEINAGKTFTHWLCDGVVVQPNDSTFKPDGNVTCVAQWSGGGSTPPAGNITISFSCGEGASGSSELNIDKTGQTAGATITLPNLPSVCRKDDYAPEKWICGGEEKEAGGSYTVPSTNVTCVIKWAAIAPAIVDKLNSSSITMHATVNKQPSGDDHTALIKTIDGFCLEFNTRTTNNSAMMPTFNGIVSCQ